MVQCKNTVWCKYDSFHSQWKLHRYIFLHGNTVHFNFCRRYKKRFFIDTFGSLLISWNSVCLVGKTIDGPESMLTPIWSHFLYCHEGFCRITHWVGLNLPWRFYGLAFENLLNNIIYKILNANYNNISKHHMRMRCTPFVSLGIKSFFKYSFHQSSLFIRENSSLSVFTHFNTY